MRPLSESPFSHSYNVLRNLGSWYYEPRDSPAVLYYSVYRLFVSFLEVYGLYGLLIDLYSVFGDLKKMSWNICVTLLAIGTITKNIQILQKYDVITSLRWELHKDAESRTTPEDLVIHDEAAREMKFLQTTFYSAGVIFIPIWLVTKYAGYFQGNKQLPIPFHVPDFIDLDSDVQYHILYLLLALSAVFVMRITIEGELSMFALLIQISREYSVFLKDIPKLNEYYEDEYEVKSWVVIFCKKEVNPWLRKVRTKMLVKELSERQRKLLEYIKAFETCFSQPLLQEFIGVSITIIAIALQCLWVESIDFFSSIMFQAGYLSITVANLFLICFYCTRIQIQSSKVGDEVYGTQWYKMEASLQKDIKMILMRSQDPPKLTMGKFVDLSLPAFAATMSQLYSWLTLFRQFEVNSV